MLTNLQPSFKLVAFALAVYLGSGMVCFYAVRDQIQGHKTNDILDALYFCIVTMTTVGYGDLVPNSIGSKLLACAFVFIGMAIVAIFISKSADYLVDKQEALLVRALHIHKNSGKAHLIRETEMSKVKHKLLMTAMFISVLMLTGTVFLVKVEKLSLVDAFYCVCSTITTLGYGDKSFSTESGRIFAIFWILISSVSLAQFFFYLAELKAEQKQQLLARYVLTRRMTFVDLEAADLDHDGSVSGAEFIVYKLKELGKISEEDIALVMEEFDDLDVDHSGKISASDIINAQFTIP
ncbi:Two pore domain potassium channel protein [Dioscorea alata]|uniref:Two pore domain potassium channel protein n=1 Tax=Dioscorea alata TaxID=55571 RepID=A0ACB7VGV0_DIOAL|nr:Two pore domain potassium channel protein [Dioscorea alata]